MTELDNIYCTRALRLLAEDARMTVRTRHLLAVLVRATPVALRGYATMVPMAELVALLNTAPADDAWYGGTEQDVLATLEDIEAAHWSMPDPQIEIGSFLNGHALSEDSGLLHFQIDLDFIAAIERISRQLRANSTRPPGMKH